MRFFRRNSQKKVFSLSDLSQLTEERKDSLAVQLSRLVKAGFVKRIAYRWYANPFSPPSKEEIAMGLRRPAYLSMEYALAGHGILSQAVHTLTLVTTKLPYTYRTEDATYEYHQIRKNLFWGYRRYGTVQTAEPEKALLDFVYIHQKRGDLTVDRTASLLDDMDVNELDYRKLREYAQRFPAKTGEILADLTA